MERIRQNKPKQELSAEQLSVYSSALVSRAMLATQLGFQYSGNRDLYQALGYPTTLKFADFYGRYVRQEIAKAIIDRPVKATWRGALELVESSVAEDTEFEKAWRLLDKKLKLRSRLSRVDRLTGIGRYGVILLGLNDVRKTEDFQKPVLPGAKQLLYVKSFSEDTARIDAYESEPTNSRYGMPLYYSIQITDQSSGKGQTVKVHYTRIIHITDDPLESEVYGTPRLEPVYNRLMDIEKIAGGDAEMFWRNARPGYQGVLDKEYTMTKEQMDKLKDEIDEFEHNLRRVFINEGVKLEDLKQQIADPEKHMQVQLQLTSSQTGIPIRVLTGSERGELASSQDTEEWLSYVQSRREDHAEPNIVRPFVDRLIELRVLPKPQEEGEYTVDWKDLFSISEKAKVEIGKGRANALREYCYNPIAQAIVPPKVFLMEFLGFTTDKLTLIEKMQKEEMGDELNDIIKDLIKKTAAPPAAGTTPKGEEEEETEE